MSTYTQRLDDVDRFFDTFFKIIFKNKQKSKLKIGMRGIVVNTILCRMFFSSSEIKLEPLNCVRPT